VRVNRRCFVGFATCKQVLAGGLPACRSTPAATNCFVVLLQGLGARRCRARGGHPGSPATGRITAMLLISAHLYSSNCRGWEPSDAELEEATLAVQLLAELAPGRHLLAATPQLTEAAYRLSAR